MNTMGEKKIFSFYMLGEEDKIYLKNCVYENSLEYRVDMLEKAISRLENQQADVIKQIKILNRTMNRLKK